MPNIVIRRLELVSPEKLQALEAKFKQLDILPSDIAEKFMTSGNKGGQKANKSNNAVYLKHLPTGIEVKCKESRERELNRFLARRILSYKIEELHTGTSERMREFDKIRKKKSRSKKRGVAQQDKNPGL